MTLCVIYFWDCSMGCWEECEIHWLRIDYPVNMLCLFIYVIIIRMFWPQLSIRVSFLTVETLNTYCVYIYNYCILFINCYLYQYVSAFFIWLIFFSSLLFQNSFSSLFLTSIHFIYWLPSFGLVCSCIYQWDLVLEDHR